MIDTEMLAEALRKLYWRHCQGDKDISTRLNALHVYESRKKGRCMWWRPSCPNCEAANVGY